MNVQAINFLLVLLFTHSLLVSWGGGSPIFPALLDLSMRSALVASKNATPTRSVPKSRVVWAVEQVLCGVCYNFQRGQYGEVCMVVLTLYEYDLFVLIWAMVRRVCLVTVSSVVFIGGGGV